MIRRAVLKRETSETSIEAELVLDGNGELQGTTGIGFFDHMLNAFVKHGLFNLCVSVTGDLYIDGHHSIEDMGIVLGSLFKQGLGDKKAIKRFASNIIPLDDSLMLCAIDLGGRPYLVFDVELPFGMVGDMDIQLAEEFFRAFVNNAGINLHFKLLYGKNVHHIIEAMFKAFGKTLDESSRIDERVKGIPSTKGVV